MSIVTVAYSPNDFYYVSSNVDLSICSSANAASLDASCCSSVEDKTNCSYYNSNKEVCYKHEVCKNKNNALLANKMENNHSGADERYINTKKQYEYEIMKTVNISSGIAIFAVATIYMMNGGIQKV
jgi:hypothetical protein